MGCQYKELRHRLEDAEKLWLYAKAATFERRALEESLDKAKSRSRYWERKAIECSEKIVGTEKERNKAKDEALVTRLVIVIVGDIEVKAEGDLARVKDALAVTEEASVVAKEARHKADAEATCLEVDQTSLLLELGTTKDEVSSLQS